MRDDEAEAARSDAHQQYAAAYTEHYTEHDLPLGMRLYEDVITSHPNDAEAEYARVQIQNIATAVVPKQERLDAQIELALIHFEQRP